MGTTVNINIDNRTVVRVMVVGVIFFLSLHFLNALRPVLTMLVVSAFLAVALNPPVSYLTSKLPRGSRVLATAIAYIIVVLIISSFLYILIPPLIDQTSSFVDSAPEYVDQLKNGDNFAADFVNRYELDVELTNYFTDLGNRLGDISGPLFANLGRVGVAIVSVLTVLVLTFLMLIEGPDWVDKFWDTVPKDQREHRKALAHKMYNVITAYVNGQLLIALLASFFSLIVMLILGIPFALPLAGLVGLFGLVPLVGATLGSMIVIVIALFQSLGAAIAMLVFFLVYQQIENNVLQPAIQSKRLDVSPLLVLVAVVIGFTVAGFIGGFIAIPTAACARILILDVHEHRKISAAKAKKKTA